jgi:hypothetical protein
MCCASFWGKLLDNLFEHVIGALEEIERLCLFRQPFVFVLRLAFLRKKVCSSGNELLFCCSILALDLHAEYKPNQCTSK